MAELTDGSTLLIHGMWHDQRSYTKWINEAGMVTFTLPGHGEIAERVKVGTYSIKDYVSALVSHIHTSGKPIHLVGHSMGGLVAMLVASDQSVAHLIKSLTLISPAPPRGIFLTGPIWGRMWRYTLSILFGRAFRPNFKDVRELVLNSFPMNDQNLLLPRFQEESCRAARDIVLMRHGVSKGDIHCPVLVMSGSDDRLLPSSMHQRLAKKLDAQFIELPWRGHMMMLEPGHEEVLNYILQWQKDVA